MKENEIEQMLGTICREKIEPPGLLVEVTKRKIKRSRLLDLVIFLSLLINTLVTVSIAVVLVLPGLGWANKVAWYLGSTMFFNVLTALLFFNREKVNEFFQELGYTVNNNES